MIDDVCGFTTDGTQAYFLVNHLDDALRRLRQAVADAGGQPNALSAATPVPELQPDDSLGMNLIYSGWGQVIGLVFWIVCLLRVMSGSGNPMGDRALRPPHRVHRMAGVGRVSPEGPDPCSSYDLSRAEQDRTVSEATSW